MMRLLVAGAAGVAVAIAIASAGATTSQTVTLGSASGTPSTNICVASFKCTYVPFTGVSSPALQVPFDGTVTSFSVNAGSAGGPVELRVLRPAGGGKYTGAGTGPVKTLSLGMNTFAVSLAVKAGDLLGLDNDSSALIFDTSPATAITAYYSPALADGATAAPNNNKSGSRLLLSTVVQASTSIQTTTIPGTTPSTTTPASAPPNVTGATESNHIWREGKSSATFSRKHRPPIGTTFTFTLNEQAHVTLAFTQRLPGRKVNGKCVSQTKRNRRKGACTRTVTRGALSFTGHSGTNNVSFQGGISHSKKLAPGTYTLVITATNSAGQHSTAGPLSFTIVR
jgi:hypothetical protein